MAIAAAAPHMLAQLLRSLPRLPTGHRLRPRPACRGGPLPPGVVRGLGGLRFRLLFFKIVLFYLLIVANIRTMPRLRVFLLCLGGLMVCQVGLGLLVYFEDLDSRHSTIPPG